MSSNIKCFSLCDEVDDDDDDDDDEGDGHSKHE